MFSLSLSASALLGAVCPVFYLNKSDPESLCMAETIARLFPILLMLYIVRTLIYIVIGSVGHHGSVLSVTMRTLTSADLGLSLYKLRYLQPNRGQKVVVSIK